jgi:hypothetical protein
MHPSKIIQGKFLKMAFAKNLENQADLISKSKSN